LIAFSNWIGLLNIVVDDNRMIKGL